MVEKKERTLEERLLAVQTELKVPKTRYNEFGNFHYRSAEDILEAVKPLLKAEGLLLTMADEMVEVGGRVYVRAQIKVVRIDNLDYREVFACAREPEHPKAKMDESQQTGATSSYARKYALNGMFALDDVKDSDHPYPEDQTKAQIKKNLVKKVDELKEKQAEAGSKIKIKLRSLILEQISPNLSPDERAEEARKILKSLTMFTTEEGEERYTSDIDKMSDKWAGAAYGKLKAQVEAKTTKELEEALAPNADPDESDEW